MRPTLWEAVGEGREESGGGVGGHENSCSHADPLWARSVRVGQDCPRQSGDCVVLICHLTSAAECRQQAGMIVCCPRVYWCHSLSQTALVLVNQSLQIIARSFYNYQKFSLFFFPFKSEVTEGELIISGWGESDIFQGQPACYGTWGWTELFLGVITSKPAGPQQQEAPFVSSPVMVTHQLTGSHSDHLQKYSSETKWNKETNIIWGQTNGGKEWNVLSL